MTLLDHDGLNAKGIKYSKAHLWRLVKVGKFPAPIRLGEARSAWVESEIDKWIADRIAERDAKGKSAFLRSLPAIEPKTDAQPEPHRQQIGWRRRRPK
jgi:prophage regulatory protein